MSRLTCSWRTLTATGAAISAFAMLAACADMSPSPAPPPAHVASNPPPVAPGPHAFWYHVSFSTGSSTIDADGQNVISQMVISLQSDPSAFATIIGKTDTVGSQNDNMHLSHRRADAVRDAILNGGNIRRDHLETRWTGEHRQDTATAGNVAEADNRVVDVAIDDHPN